MPNRLALLSAAALVLAAAPLRAQDAAEHVAAGEAARAALDLPAALAHFEAALAADSMDYAANWLAAITLIDIGKQTPDAEKSATRDSLYDRAERLARRAVAANPQGADGHFVLAFGVGRAALTKSKQEQVKRATEIRNIIREALALDPDHDGAYHVWGRWHAEIMRLSGVQRFFAKQFMGAAVFNEASWDEAVRNLERAVALRPDFIYHRLDLGAVYVDRKRYEDARTVLAPIAELPVIDINDPVYKREAEALLAKIAGKRQEKGGG